MSLFETNHPFSQDLEALHGALISGMADTQDHIPDNLKLNYEDPISAGDGVGTLVVADWERENQTNIYFPLTTEDCPDWQVTCENGNIPIRQRIFTRDLLDRGFLVNVNGEAGQTPYLQFDVTDDGVIFSARTNGNLILSYGDYDGDMYDMFVDEARTRAGVAAIVELAFKY